LQNENANNLFANLFAKPEPKPSQKVIPLPANAMWKTNNFSKPVRLTKLLAEKDGLRQFQSEEGVVILESELVF
jgi:hypothetical protein